MRDWVGGIRFSAFTGIMLGLVILGALVLVPSISTLVQQRQAIAAAQESVRVTTEQVAALEAERARWDDPAYVTAQARDRLFYVMPGEVVYIIDNDLPAEDQPVDESRVSAEVGQTRTDWMTQLVRSVATAGTAEVTTGSDSPAPSLSPSPSGSPTSSPVP